MRVTLPKFTYPHTNTLAAQKYAICSFSIFLITLQDFYYPVVGSFLTYVGLVMFLSLLAFKRTINIDKGFVAQSAVSFLLLAACFFILVIRWSTPTDVKSAVALAAMLVLMVPVYGCLKGNKDLVVRSLEAVIIVHVVILGAQVGYFIITRHYLDLLHLLTGITSRVVSPKGIVFEGALVPRFSGLFAEPGDFGATVMSMAIVVFAYKKRITHSVVLAIIASLATMSLYGMVLIGLLWILHIANRRKLRFGDAFILACLLGAFVYMGGYQSLADRFASPDGGFSFRDHMLQYLFSSPTRMLSGVSISDFPQFVTANDIGAWYALWIAYGIAGAALAFSTVAFAYMNTRSKVATAVVVVIFLTKLKLTYPLFWVLIVCVIALAAREGYRRTTIDEPVANSDRINATT